jgi:hypothetical protein
VLIRVDSAAETQFVAEALCPRGSFFLCMKHSGPCGSFFLCMQHSGPCGSFLLCMQLMHFPISDDVSAGFET